MKRRRIALVPPRRRREDEAAEERVEREVAPLLARRRRAAGDVGGADVGEAVADDGDDEVPVAEDAADAVRVEARRLALDLGRRRVRHVPTF